MTPTQVDEIVRTAADSRAPTLSSLVADALNAPLEAPGGDSAAGEERDGGRRPARGRRPQHGFMPREAADQRLSRSLLRGLSVLTCFGAGQEERGIVEMAADLEMSPSTAHRYAVTLVELGLLERCPNTRKYRLPARPD
ncbi:MAG TPA: helix-turn-helix domain-containing protein [Solirubrobacteraceae bacterium]